MIFGNPEALYWTAAAFLFAAGLAAFGLRRRDALLSRFAASRLLEGLTERAGTARVAVKTVCILLAITAAGIALSRPQYGVEYVERKARGLDIVFALDVSRSMLATDLRPSRLQRARLAVIDLVRRLENDRVGLVAFAGQAFLQCPPTLDYDAFRESLNAAGPGALTRGGSDLASAIREAAQAFPAENNVKVVVLLTDGEDLAGNALDAAREAAKAGITLHTVGIGTPSGVYLRAPGADGSNDFIRDTQGQPVLSRLNEAMLHRMAAETGGQYSRLESDSLEELYRSVLAALPRSERDSEMREVPIERFQWLLGVALLFVVLEMLIRRRRMTGSALALAWTLFLLPAPLPAQTTGEAPPDADLPEAVRDGMGSLPDRDPVALYNLGVELLRSGDYGGARDAFREVVQNSDDLGLKQDAVFNLGHAENQLADSVLGSDPVAALENMKTAERHFHAAKDSDPADETAAEAAEQMTRRREALEEWLKQQQEQEEQEQDQSQQDQEGEDGEEQEEQDGGDGQQGDSGENGRNSDTPESSDGEDENQNQADDGQEENEAGQQDDGQEEDDSSEGDNEGEEQSSSEEQDGESPDDGDAGSDPTNPDDLSDSPEASGQSEAENAGDEREGQAASAAGTEGMSEEEARALLEALRGSERLLPFGQSSGEASDTKSGQRDW